MQYLTATDSNGIEVCLFQLEGNFFISVPKEQLGLNSKTETQNSGWAFEKVKEEIQTQIVEFPGSHQKFVFERKVERDGDSIKIGDWEYKGVKTGKGANNG